MGRIRVLVIMSAVLLAICVGSWGTASSIIPPASLGEMAVNSELVIIAKAQKSDSARVGQLIFTYTRFRVVESLRGPYRSNDFVTVETPGGEVEDSGWIVAGSPHFEPGETYFLCLRTNDGRLWQPTFLAYGILHRRAAPSGENILEPLFNQVNQLDVFLRADGMSPEPVGSYREKELLDHLVGVLVGAYPWEGKKALVDEEDLQKFDAQRVAPAGCKFLGNARWKVFDTGGRVTVGADSVGDQSLPSEGFTEIEGALSIWNSISGTKINLVFGGPVSYTLKCSGSGYPAAGQNIVVFNDPCHAMADLDNCSGVLGMGGPYYQYTHTFDGKTWNSIISMFLILNNGIGCIGSDYYTKMVAHELGHGLGFDHVNDPDAMMYGYCCNEVNDTDRSCTQYLYPRPVTLTAGFSVSPPDPIASKSVKFVDLSLSAKTWSWDFGDGKTSSEKSPSHVYSTRGKYVVIQVVSDGTKTARSSQMVTVYPTARRHIGR